ncbi:MAG: hypothetical protein KIT69_13425, partial [Propionibacteriaceae bacterium]|nr:hypothetical protein [Propionibacteriaceae bacterium]
MSATAPRPWARATTRQRAATIGYHVAMLALVFAYVFPALWAVSMSFRTNENMYAADQLIPHPATLEHYHKL